MRSRNNPRRSGSPRKSDRKSNTRPKTEHKSTGGASFGKRPSRRSDGEEETPFKKRISAKGRSEYKKKSYDKSSTRGASSKEESSMGNKESARGRSSFKRKSYDKSSTRSASSKEGSSMGNKESARGRSGFKRKSYDKSSTHGASSKEGSSIGSKESARGRSDFKKKSFVKSSSRRSSIKDERSIGKKESGERSRFKKDSYSKSSNRRSSDKREGFSSKRSDNRSDFGQKFGKSEPRTEKKSFNRKSQPKRYAKTTPAVKESLQSGTEQIRLNKYIANSGVCSRREADELIKMGLVSVNNKAITELGYKVNPGDVVKYEGKTLRAEKPVYILLNKPKGYLTTTKDPQERNTVMHIVGKSIKERIYPVGRLDRNTTGLLLLTNDGDLAEKLSHPSYNVRKIYKVELDKPLTKADFQKVLEGVKLEEGRAIVDDLAFVSDDGKIVGLELHIGWNRVVRRIFEVLEYTVVKLDRSVYAGLDKKDLPRGHWRHLTQQELIQLKHYNKK